MLLSDVLVVEAGAGASRSIEVCVGNVEIASVRQRGSVVVCLVGQAIMPMPGQPADRQT